MQKLHEIKSRSNDQHNVHDAIIFCLLLLCECIMYKIRTKKKKRLIMTWHSERKTNALSTIGSIQNGRTKISPTDFGKYLMGHIKKSEKNADTKLVPRDYTLPRALNLEVDQKAGKA